MTPVFADTSYFLALLGPGDQHHQQAMAWTRALRRPLLTTEYIVLEIGNSLTRGADRALFVEFVARLRADRRTEVVQAASEWLSAGVNLFAARSDQTWSLTDCISFSVMTQRRLTDALTADRHFEQAGFRALLLHPPDTASDAAK
jgi:predicted nucleic acid-binding protein